MSHYAPVAVAFWANDSEAGQWYLYMASEQIDDDNVDLAYGEVLRLAGEMANPYFDPFHVKLIPASDPLAQAALDINRRYPGNSVTRLGGRNFGGLGVEGVYLYPASATLPTA